VPCPCAIVRAVMTMTMTMTSPSPVSLGVRRLAPTSVPPIPSPLTSPLPPRHWQKWTRSTASNGVSTLTAPDGGWQVLHGTSSILRSLEDHPLLFEEFLRWQAENPDKAAGRESESASPMDEG
jgi:hypothetical protein